ncbi:MAG TPA: HYR domain-containing protein, partial [Blastocatellia bacterium]|nr:HYR domain-containing protein [Blastocatellia bacterium]
PGASGTFNPDASTPNATFTHTGGTGTITLRWTITSPPCASSSADVVITITQPPTMASTGGAQTICAGSTTAGLGGNPPTSGTGMWSIVSGGTGTFSPNASTGNATFTPTSGAGTYVLRWTISNPPCTASFADVTITAKQPPTATVGANQTICALATTAGLGGNLPAGGATGQWSVVSGGTGTFSPNATTPNATFTHQSGSGPIVLRWTVANPPCADATADVTISITQPPTQATVGPSQTIAPGGTTAGLGGNSPKVGSGQWSIVTAGAAGTFNPNAATPNATFTHISGSGQIVLRWTIANPPCPAATAEVTIQIGVAPQITCPASPVMANAATGACSANVSFNVTASGIPVPTVNCAPPSGSSFPVGTTTVICTASNGVLPNASCSFTVKINDTQPPVFVNGCPAAVSAVTQITCPMAASQSVAYQTPAVSDNCPGATVACAPPSGSVFAVGTTSVSCTATDASGNTASCSFAVKVWTACLQDESNPGNVCQFDGQTGEYQFCCNGVVVASGVGTANVRGCVVQIDHIKGNRKVSIRADLSVKRGTATVIIANQTTCGITDQNMANNNCQCPTGAKP